MNPLRLSAAFQRIRDSLRGVALRVTGSGEDADDALQDVFVRLWSNAPAIPEPDNVEAYISTAVRNRSLDVVRQRRPSVDSIPDNLENSENLENPENPDDPDSLYSEVQRIIDSHLPPAQREIIRLRDVEELEFSEIANRMGMSEGTVRVNLSRARATVRKIYRSQL